ncbi:MAG TPA: hypothetical protein PKA54_01495 [Chitinophagaceae bacterium]|nr:hypothetical protein [Chitinophagaceae bacterium]
MIYLLILFLSYTLIQNQMNETNSFIALTVLMAKTVLYFSIIIVLISFFSVLLSSLYFYFQLKKFPAESVQITTQVEKGTKDILLLKTKLPFALKPILGTVSIKLFYDHILSTEPMILASRIKKQFIPFRSGIEGSNELLLPYIKDYHFSKSLVIFEDMLHLFSIVIPSKINNEFVNFPKSLSIDVQDISPQKTEEENRRIDQIRKVEGELFNYKKFEDADDVRRIVWKIYAKNKELVVRKPETLNPFASHIYMYASFYNALHFESYPQHSLFMLNYFKNCVWTIYETIAKGEMDIRYISDQTIHSNNQEIDKTKYEIALSGWHHNESIEEYFKPKIGSLLCIHSCTSYEGLEKIISSLNGDTKIFFVKLNRVFKSYFFASWIMNIFFKAPDDDFANIKSKWILHPLRRKMIHNEEKMISLLEKEGIKFEII